MKSTVSQTHPAYDRNLYSWTMVRDAVEGESAVKSKGTMYLPMPAAMQMLEYSSSPVAIKSRTAGWKTGDPVSARLSMGLLDPNYDSNPAYSAYIMRAQFPELSSFILRGLLGLALSDSPTVKVPKKLEYLLEQATPTGMSLEELYAKAVIETLSTGRFTLYLNIVDGKVMFLPYSAEGVINWKARRAMNSKASDLSFIVFEEWEDDPNEFSHDLQPRYYVARDLGSSFAVESYSADRSEPDSIITPTLQGRTLPYVPAVTIGSISNGTNPNPIPLYSIASTSVQIYMRTADLGNSEFVSCNPTFVMTGVDKEEAPRALGSTVVLTLPNEAAKAFYTHTDTSALNHVMTHINDLYERAVYFGAQLLDSSKKAAESAETTRLKQASSGATLSSVVMNVARGFQDALKMAADWYGIERSEIEFKAITEFMAPALTANEQKVMVESWMSGAMSKFTLLDNFRRAGVLPAGSTVEEEMSRIDSEGPKTVVSSTSVTSESPDEDDDAIGDENGT